MSSSILLKGGARGQDPAMNAEQLRAFETVQSGHNVFITGPAGTGKSFVIQHIKDWVTSQNKTLSITAMTGCAAVLIGGRTLHSALGIGLAQGNSADVVAKIYTNPTTTRKLRDLEVLIVDEISMMSDDLFDKISAVLSVVRENPQPFGGIQLILCGDFAQLPPVSGNYCFKSPEWARAVQETVVLTTLMRQLNDATFQNMLSELRMGKCSADTFSKLKALMLTEESTDSPIQPTVLYSLRRDVDAVNAAEYGALVKAGAQERAYATDYGGSKGGTKAGAAGLKAQAKKWGDNVSIPTSTTLCIGAQVVVTANVDIESGVVNGSRGVVTRLGVTGPEIVLLDGRRMIVEPKRLIDDSNRLSVTYCPLQYAWALTINKSQGMTLDKAVIDLGGSVFASGQAYTALSRVRDLDSVRLSGLSKRSFILHPDVAAFYASQPLF